MKSNSVAAILVGAILIASQRVNVRSQDLSPASTTGADSMFPNFITAFGEIQQCMSNNNVDIGAAITNFFTTFTYDQNFKCGYCCVLQGFAMADEHCNPQLSKVKSVAEMIPIPDIKDKIVGLLTKCEAAGKAKENEKCEAAFAFKDCVVAEVLTIVKEKFASIAG
ncbi:hypothetical protein C0J52_16455 [Blattella germanica]|nr:hypothetical protein C0J52_16455 [Blattella germanica]